MKIEEKMKVEQIYTGCLAQGAYYIESDGEAVVIDPLREVQPYIAKAENRGAKIKYVLETHFHADFVSGHVDLAKKTGATIVFGPTAKPEFDALVAHDGEQLKVGRARITIIHTPGHTMESTCYLLSDEEGKDIGLFTGDTLFIGDVGRPDLAQKVVKDLTQEKLAAYLYRSLREKIMPLADDIIVYPAHGAGSACGKNMSKETTDTLGNQKKTNYALQEMSEDDFIVKVLDGLLPPPGYFPENVQLNIQGSESIDEVLSQGLQGLDVQQFEAIANEKAALILDTRNAQVFAQGFIPNAINIGIDGSFAPWVGALVLDIKQPLLIVADEGREEEVVTRLARVGYDHTLGYLSGGFEKWKEAAKEYDTITSIGVEEFAGKVKATPSPQVLDVRKASEYFSEHVLDAQNVPLDYINEHVDDLDREQTYYIHCAAGYRSMIFASILNARGFKNLVDVQGGFKSIKESGLVPISDYRCPTTMP